MAVSAERCGELLERLRGKRPLVHNITNAVAMDVSANVLLAIGASPAMVMAVEEVADFARVADSLVANIGTLSAESIEAMRRAAAVMQRDGKPWVLDPVGCGATPFRLAAARELASLQPQVIRGNPGEIASLGGAVGLTSRGVDTLMSSDQGVKDAAGLAGASGCTVAMTGEVDYVIAGDLMVTVVGGAPIMPYVTGLGCALSATTAAFLAVAPPVEAAVAAMASFAVAGQRAARKADAPGRFRQEFIDELYRLTPRELAAEARISDA